MKPDYQPLTIALIGCGKMGSAMLDGWLDSGIARHIHVLDPASVPAHLTLPSVTIHKDATSLEAHRDKIDLLALAVKPQIMDDVCQSLRKTVGPRMVVMSIAAGQPIALYEKHFGAHQPVIRVMPNTPAAIGKGISVVIANSHTNDEQKRQAQLSISCFGPVEWITDESLMNAVTALSGSGPAYVYHLIEVMAKAGERQGLPADLAMKLARQTVIGSAALAEKDKLTSAATLRQNVTSPGGTTEAALKVLMESGEMQNLFNRALEAATRRGQELSKSL